MTAGVVAGEELGSEARKQAKWVALESTGRRSVEVGLAQEEQGSQQEEGH
jgi:hypothetical protein